MDLLSIADQLEGIVSPGWLDDGPLEEWCDAFGGATAPVDMARQNLVDYIDFLVAVIFGPEPEPKPPSTAFTAGWNYYPGEK